MPEPKAEAKRVATKPDATTVAEEKRYPVVHTVVVGRGEIRSSGFVTASEVGGDTTIEQLLRLGVVSDPDAPVRPSEASDAKARGILVDTALASGIMTREGADFVIGGKTLPAAELQALPLAELSAMIVAALKARE